MKLLTNFGNSNFDLIAWNLFSMWAVTNDYPRYFLFYPVVFDMIERGGTIPIEKEKQKFQGY